MSTQLWKVVGGGDKGGILVREEWNTRSPELPERLQTDALVKEVSLIGERLQYELVDGKGPKTGWVSTILKSKELVVKYEVPEVSLSPPADTWRLIYFDTPTRGEQVRLLFHLTGTPFEDVKFSKFPSDLDPYRYSFIGDKSPLAFDQAPCLQYNGVSICQVAAIMQFVGEKLGLVDDNPEARAQAAMWMLGSEQMRNNVFYPAFEAVNDLVAECNAAGMEQMDMLRKLNGLQPHFCDMVPYDKWMGFFERRLRETGDPFLLGSKECYADIGLYDCVTAVWGVPICEKIPDRKKKFPMLTDYIKRVRALPKLKEHLDKRGEFWNAMTKVWNGEILP